MAKKFFTLDSLTTFIDEIKALVVNAISTHKHKLSDITDYKVDTELSSTSTNPIANSAVDEEFEAVSQAMGALENAIDGKADASHTHSISNVTNLQSTLDAKVPASRTVNGKSLTYNITLSASDVGADASGAANSAVSSHNTSTSAHNDIRDLINGLTTRLNTLADSDDTTLDQMSEIVEYIKANKSLIDSITTSKVNVSDIVNNLTTNVTNKPLSAAQGVAIKALIDALQTAVNGKADSLSDLGVTATATELNYVDGVTSAIQTQLDGKAASGHTHNYAGSSSAGGAATSANKVNSSLTVKLNGGTTEGTNLFTFNGSAEKSVNITPSAIGAAASSHNHDDRYYTETEVDTKLSGKANTSHGNHVPTTQTANNATFLRNDNTWQKVTPANIGAAASSHTHTVANITDLTATAAELNYMDGVTSNVQTQLDGKAASSHNHAASNITSGTLSSDRLPTVPIGKGGTGATTAAAALTNLGITATAAELNYVDGVTSSIQTQLNNKASKSSATQAAAGLMSAEDKIQMDYGGIPIVTTGGTGSAYTATIDGITELKVGTKITIIPHVISAANAPTLNLNSLGAKAIRMPVSYSSSTTANGATTTWLAKDRPVTLEYNGTYWLTIGLTRPSANYLSGTVPIANGGTGADTAAGALTNLGLTATATELNYCDGVTSNIQTQINNLNNSLANTTATANAAYTSLSTKLDVNGIASSANTLTGLKYGQSSYWGNQIGTCFASFADSTGGGWQIRQDNPIAGQMSFVIDGCFYQNEGNYRCIDTSAFSLSGTTLYINT